MPKAPRFSVLVPSRSGISPDSPLAAEPPARRYCVRPAPIGRPHLRPASLRPAFAPNVVWAGLLVIAPPTWPRRRKVALGAVLSVLALGLVALIALTPSLNAPLRSFLRTSLTRQPDRFSELFFTDYGSVPKVLEVHRKYPVSFTTVNRQGRRWDYTCRASVFENNKLMSVTTFRFTLSDDQSVTRLVNLVVTRPHAHVLLEVSLVAMPQAILLRATG